MKKWEGENENANGKFMREKDLSKEMEGGRVLNFGCYQRKDALSHGLAGKECKLVKKTTWTEDTQKKKHRS